MNDLKFAFRQLLKNPGFTAVAVLTLALGIGANTAIFSFVNAILLRPLPYKDPERLVMVYENHRVNGWLKNWVGAPMLAEWRKQSTVFEGLGARTSGRSSILTGLGAPETLRTAGLSANIFTLLGVKPIFGRDFLPEEEVHGKHHVVILSYEFWQRRFGGNTNIIGQNLTLDSEPKIVIGIMPPRTHFPERSTQVWFPLAFSWELQARHAHNFLVYGKLKPGVSVEQANTEMKLIAERMAAADGQNKGWGTEVHVLHDIIVSDVERVLLVLLGAVGLVLLIGCANIANLILARSTARAHEFAIRVALGAGRSQLIRQLLSENLVLFVAGGLGGVALAAVGLGGLVRLSPQDLPRVWEGIHLDEATLVFATVMTLGTGVLFGLVPAFQASNPALARELTESARGSVGIRRQRLRSALVVGEVALSVVLLIGAGLMIRSFVKLLTQNMGFNPEQIVTMNISLPSKTYPVQSERPRQLFDQLLDAVRTLPGVQAAAGAHGLPLAGWHSHQVLEIIGAPPPAPGDAVSADYAQVSPGYFTAMNIRLLQGRDFTENDRTNTTPVLIVDETFVRNFKFGTNVLGRRVKLSDSGGDSEIIGEVKSVKRSDLAAPPRGTMYRSYKQICWGELTLVIRTQREAADLTRAIRSELDRLDKDVPIENVRTMTQLVSSSVAQRKLSVQLLGGFAGVALLLAAIGLYGVLAYSVSQRTREIGIRSALGAQHSDVIGLVLRQGMKLTGLGILIGLAGAFALTQLIRNLLFGVEPGDPFTFATIPLLLSAVAVLACWLPARRAARVDPMEALRYE